MTGITPMQATQQILWHLGDTNYGIQPGSFHASLIQAMFRADTENLELLELGFPTLVRYVRLYKATGIETLIGIVKAELDHVEQGLDMSVLS